MEIIEINGHWLPIAFGFLLALSVFLYMVLDGYDLGVGLLLPFGRDIKMQTSMIASMGPFWDANETWLVLSVGIILIAFPMAHGIILTALYLPVFVLLLGIIMRGVAYEFRNNCKKKYIVWWHRCFFLGSFVMSISQGYIIGIFSSGLIYTTFSNQLAILIAVVLTLTYAFNGASWMIIKSEHALYELSIVLAKRTLRTMMLSVFALMVFLLYEFGFIQSTTHLILFCLTLVIYFVLEFCLKGISNGKNWRPFIGVVLLLSIYVITIVYTSYPYIIPSKMTVWEGAASIEALRIIFIGAMIILPMIIAYNILLHKVFWGKLSGLSYD